MKNKGGQRVNFIRSFRLKIAIYTFISLCCTALTDLGILFLLFIYHRQTDNFALQVKNIEEQKAMIAHYGIENMNENGMITGFMNGKITLLGSPILDLLLLVGFSAILFTAYFVLISHNMISYLREIQKGIERIKGGDFDTGIPVINDDELSMMADSINEMRITIKDLMEKERMAEKTKNDLITNVAHDLRTPLTSIIGYLELLRKNEELESDTRKRYIQIVYDKSKRLQNLVVDLFDYTRYVKTGVQANKNKLELNHFIEQLVEEFYPNFQDNHLECDMKIWENNIYLLADGELLSRAFGNLLANAIQYGSDGKLVIVKTEVIGEKAKVSIVNFGQIIPKNELHKIFEKFYRVEASRSMSTGGTGLGLAITKNIIVLHQGKIRVQSDENGTVFEVYLPIKTEEVNVK